ncbi:alpha/beta fold hydrolase [Shewanella gaetbuli]|uniref:Alpha/beta hydrolase n=1 Tax=Shewanella gaetbuli TaxID=220752 RepID=A0A9X1ZPT6_9GAMM|nr:alpha/beta hydrolase [Shewanella gaetbuli]MCL1143377.1 alpha/beta hydrolase [Shewanella gaetbuli]
MLVRIFLLAMLLLNSGCSVVGMVDNHQQKQLISNGFELHDLTLAQGGSLHYWQGGDKSKPCVILLHGFGGTGLTSWYEIMQNISDDYYVIVPDLLWFGESYSGMPANISSQSTAISALINHLNLSTVNLVGISFGGFVTFDLMIQEPKVNKAIMLASPGLVFTDEDMHQMTQRFGKTKPESVFVPRDKEGVRLLLEHTFVDYPWYPGFIDEQVYQTYFASFQQQKASLITTLPAYRDSLHPQDIKPNLPPSLLIWGDKDIVFPLAKGVEFSQYLNAEIKVIPGGAHGLSNDFPEQISQSIKEFF